jgi:HD-like signal output (HDOD) protein
MTDTESILDQLSARSAQLYSLPGVALQVLQLTRDPHVDTRALKECIENDPAIASRILRAVNSSLFAPSREVANLGQALPLLGIKPLKLLVLSFSLPSGLFVDVEAKTLLWYWKHALTKAVAGRELSHRLWRIPGDEAFLAGLFQDLGALLLFQHLGQPYARLLDQAVSRQVDLCAVEQRTLGFPHTELSARLLRQWRLPESLYEAVGCQSPEQRGYSALAQILHLSELFARLLADGQTSALPELLDAAHGYSHYLDHQLEPLVAEVEAKVNELADIFSLALPDGLEYRDVLAEAHRQLTGVATQAAEDLLRGQVPERAEVDEDWILTELDSLADALAEACARPVETTAAAIGESPSLAAGAAARQTSATAVAARPATTPPRPMTAAPNLLDRLTGVVAICRSARRPLSLLLVKLSVGDELLGSCGPQELAAVRNVLAKVCGRLDHPGKISLPHTEFGFALILPAAERTQAVELGNDLIRAVRNVAGTVVVSQKDWLKVDIGVASIAQLPKNFPPRDLLDGADRCLYASHASGGGVVKSIEIY